MVLFTKCSCMYSMSFPSLTPLGIVICKCVVPYACIGCACRLLFLPFGLWILHDPLSFNHYMNDHLYNLWLDPLRTNFIYEQPFINEPCMKLSWKSPFALYINCLANRIFTSMFFGPLFCFVTCSYFKMSTTRSLGGTLHPPHTSTDA